MEIFKNISLKPYNTFGIDVQAETFVVIQSEEDLKVALARFSNPFILGGGSNMLLTNPITHPVFYIQIKGITVLKQTEDFVWVQAKAGENWNDFVLFCLQKGWGGLENLSLIPGNVGTTPVQNIGAYGVEIKDVIELCETMDMRTSQVRTFSKEECRFDYRESVFKGEEKGNYVITSVTFKLTKRNHLLRIGYGAIQEILEQKNIKNPTPRDVSDVVISIRKSKLPDPKELGNSGSFFKNPIIAKSHFGVLQKQYPQMPFYYVDEERVKIPAGWLIETSGLKGYRKADAGVHQKQALVLVNYGRAEGKEILEVARLVQTTVFEKFGITLDLEVNVF